MHRPLIRGARMRALERTHALLELAPDGTIMRANHRSLALLGYRRADLVGKPYALLLPAADRDGAALHARWAQLQRGADVEDECTWTAADGSVKRVVVVFAAMRRWNGRIDRLLVSANAVETGKRQQADRDGTLAAFDRFSAMIEFAPDGTILSANANFLDAVGYTLAEIAGRHHRLFVTPEERESETYRTFWSDLGAGIVKRGECRRLRKDGREIWLQAIYSPILDGAGEVRKVVKIATDITAEKLGSIDAAGKIAAIDKSQAMIEFALDGTILTANENFLRVVGYRLDEIRGQHHRMFVSHDERDSPAYLSFWAALARGEHRVAEFRRIGKNGREIWLHATYNPILDPSGRPLKVVKIASDITADVENRRQFKLLSLVANETDNSVIITDAEGRIEFVNPGFTRMTGYTADEVLGRKPGDFLQGPATSAQTRSAIRDRLSRNEAFYDEILNYTKNGDPYWISLAINPIFGEDGRLVNFISIQANVTQTKKASVQRGVQLDAISASNAICEWSVDGALLSANPYLRALGADLSPMAARTSSLLTADDEAALRSGQQLRREIGWPSGGNGVVWLDAILSLLTDVEGRPERILMCAVDITTRRRAMEQTQSAMADVLASAQQISDISGAIDRIARQTNLLALNATIEASRAGDAGKGFAVVASEVKQLASRSSASSAEIASLVAETQQRIGVLAENLTTMNASRADGSPSASHAQQAGRG